LRFEVFKRDGFACQYCGAHPPDVLLEADHITPVAAGGEDSLENLVTACQDCNRGKGAVPLSVVPKSLAEKALEIEEREAQLEGYRKIVEAHLERIERDAWQVADILFPGCSKDGLRRDWFKSIKTFNTRLPLHEVKDAAEIAMCRHGLRSDYQLFKYFCGVCWKKIRDGVQ
jgi:hypothetical protein